MDLVKNNGEDRQKAFITLTLDFDQLAKLRSIFQYVKEDKQIPDKEKMEYIDLCVDITNQVNHNLISNRLKCKIP